MNEGQDKIRIEETFARLQTNREALPWPERRALAQSLAETLISEGVSEPVLALVFLLADDPKWEVRRDIADCLLLIPEDDFPRLAAKLSADSNSFVRKAAERALDRRRRGQRAEAKRQRGLDGVQSQYVALEKIHGKVAAEKARHMAERLYDILVGATVHDMRGIMTPLKSSVTTLLSHLEESNLDPKLFHKNLIKMKDRIAILEWLLEDMRQYSQPTPLERRRERFAEVVHKAHDIVKDRFKATDRAPEGILVNIDVPENITLEISRQQIIVAIANILQNAYEAFETRPNTFQKGTIELRARTLDNERIEIVVQDNGLGLSKEDLAKVRLFVPGGSSKKQHGSGLGLPNARKRVIDHGGDLAIDSEENQGTTVTITLPVETEGQDQR